MRLWPFSTTVERSARPVAEAKSLADPTKWESELLGLYPAAYTSVVVSPANAMRSTAVRRAVQAIAEPIGQLPLHLYRRTEDSREREREHPVAKVLLDPNDWTSSQDFREQLQRDALLQGNAFAYIVRVEGKPVELIRLDPATIEVKRNAVGEPSYQTRDARPKVFPFLDIFHLKAPSYDGLKGASIVVDCREAIALALVLEEHGNRLFGNGARPSGVISTPKPLGDEGVRRMLAGWRAAHEGPGKSGRSAVLYDGATWSAETFNSVDSQFLELRRYAVDEIARAFNVPPHLLFEMGRATWGNAAELGSMFVTFSLTKWLKAWQGEIRLKLISREERDALYAEFLIDDLVRADIGQRFTAYSQARSAGWLNADEVRARENLPPIPGGAGQSYANPNTATAPTVPPADASQGGDNDA